MRLHVEAEVEMKLPMGGTASLLGEADDVSVIGSIASHHGDYEPELMAVLVTLVSRDSICLDVGANVGPITLALSSLCPDGFVYAFEPAEQSFRFLERNLARNRTGNATARRLALSDASGEATLSYNRQFAGGAFISNHLRDGAQETVRVGTIDVWAQREGLHRLDLIKVDVEGHEEQVLRGALTTISRFRPTLVVEVNPIALRRMQERHPQELFRCLRSLYGGGGRLAVVAESGHMVPLWSWPQLRRQLAEAGICNLVCSPARLLPGLRPGVAGPREVLAVLGRAVRRHGRFSTPPWAAVVDPQVTIHLAGDRPDDARRLHGTAGQQLVVALRIENRGDGAIVGDAERFPVSVRTIWIDDEGHHRVDDRSRIPAPTLRPGAARSTSFSLVLPDRPGQYTARITLFQEHMAWFHDLDPTNCLDLSVFVSA